jgi:hypothetical protein
MLYDIGLIEQLLQLCLLPPADRIIVGETMLAYELDARVRHEERHVHWQMPLPRLNPAATGKASIADGIF